MIFLCCFWNTEKRWKNERNAWEGKAAMMGKRWKRKIVFLLALVLAGENIGMLPALEIRAESTLTGAYISGGALYLKSEASLPEEVSVTMELNEKGEIPTEKTVISDVKKTGKATSLGYEEYVPYQGKDAVIFSDGKYKVHVNGVEYPVVSVLNYHVDSGNRTLNGKEMPFCDYVYPVIYNGNAYGDEIRISINATELSLDPSQWPKILRDGNKEDLSVSGGTNVDMTYPKMENKKEPKVYSDMIPQTTDVSESLDHKDKLTFIVEGELAEVYFWDQISKIWYKENVLKQKIGMTYVKGGTFQMESGQDGAYQAAVSDFWMGTYEVTMEQFYQFVEDCTVTQPEDVDSAPIVSYTVGNTTRKLNEIAAYMIADKKTLARDHGWGVDNHPAIDISFYEAVEFCNYQSFKEGYEPCYTFTDICNGEVSAGKTAVNYWNNIFGSVMQKGNIEEKKIQLVRVECDFSRNGYRLPTECEFEYAAKGGAEMTQVYGENGSLYAGNHAEGKEEDGDLVGYYSWFTEVVQNPKKNGNDEGEPFTDGMGGNGYSSMVGSKLPNLLGIYDLSGNVWEHTWRSDCTYYEGIRGASYLQGGCFSSTLQSVSSVAQMEEYQPSEAADCVNLTDARIGFRLARSASEEDKEEKGILSVEEEQEVTAYVEQLLFMFHSKNDEYNDDLIAAFYTEDANKIVFQYDDTKMGIGLFNRWIFKVNDRSSYHLLELLNIDIRKKADESYAVNIWADFYDEPTDSHESASVRKYEMKILKSDNGYKVDNIVAETLTLGRETTIKGNDSLEETEPAEETTPTEGTDAAEDIQSTDNSQELEKKKNAKITVTSPKGMKKTCQYKKLKKKKQIFTIKASVNSGAKITYSVSGKTEKYIKVTSKGKVTVVRNTPKGTYCITLKAGDKAGYKPAKKVTVKVVV